MPSERREGPAGALRNRFSAWRKEQEAHRLEPRVAPPIPSTEGADYVMREVALISGRFLVITAAGFVLYLMLDRISLVTITMTVAVMISAVLRPAVNRLVESGMPRWFAATMTFLLGVMGIFASAWFVISQITNSMDTITAQLRNANTEIFDWLVNGPLRMSQSQIADLSTEVTAWLDRSQDDLVSGAYTTATNAISVVSGIVLCLFALLFLLLDDGSIWRWFVGLFPKRAQDRVEGSGDVAWRTLVAYMRSLVLLALINALTMVVIMMIGRIELYVPLGVLLFLGALIPLVGMLVAGLVLILIALVMNGPVTALVMLIALLLTVQIEGNLLNPYILGKAVNIHPLAILATVTAGTLAGGIYGAFIAVPLVAMVNNVAVALRDRPEDQPPAPLLEAEDFPEMSAGEPNPQST